MDLKLSVLLGAIDRATAPLRSITGSSTATSKALRDTRQRLKELDKTQAEIRGFRKLKNDTDASRLAMRSAVSEVAKLRAGMASVANPTKQAAAELAKAERNVTKLKTAHMAQLRTLRDARAGLVAAGIDTRRLGDAERKLGADITATTQKMAAQQAKLKQISQQQQQMATAHQTLQRGQATAAHVAVGGYAAMATGQHVLGALSPAIDEAKAFQTQVSQLRSLGIGDAMVSDAVKFAKGMDVMGNSATDNLKLLKESYSVLRDMHEAEQVTPYLARMKFGIEAVMARGGHGEGHGANAEAMFMDLLKVAELRGAAKDPQSLKRVLDFSTQAYVASGGMVKPEDLLNMIKTGGIAAKQVDDTSFFFGLLHTMQEMGGHRTGTGLATAYQNWAAGRSTQQAAEELANLGLLNKDAVKYGKTGHVTKLLPDALKDGELYRSNPFEYLMTRVIPKINPDGKLTDHQVMSKINALFSGRKGGDLFASLFMERKNIAKQLANAPKAYGVDALYGEAGKNADGQLLELTARKNDLYRELGTQLLPLYVSGLQKLVNVMRNLTGWSERHPAMAKGMLVVAGSAGVLLTAVGGLMIALGGLMGQFALLRFVMRMGGLRLAGMFGGTGGLSAITSGARMAMAALAGLTWPVIALIAVITLLALVVRKYWQPIAAWFSGIGEGIRNVVGPALDELGTTLAPLKPAFDLIASAVGAAWRWFTQLLDPVKSTQAELDGARSNGVAFGEAIGAAINGVVQAVSFGVKCFVWLGEAIGNAAGFLVTAWDPVRAWFTDMWQGIEDSARKTLDWIGGKLQAVSDFIQRIRNFGNEPAPVPAGGAPIDWIMPGDTERHRKVREAIARTPLPGGEATTTGTSVIAPGAPMAPRAPASPTVMEGDTHVHIDARGSDPGQVKKAVHEALSERDRQRQARDRSAYKD